MLKLLLTSALAFASNPWSELKTPVPSSPPQIYGAYALGCIKGAKELKVSTPYWEIVNPGRHRNFAHPDMEAFLTALGKWSKPKYGKIIVGDISQPAGGPLPTGHNSHEVGLDVDLRFSFLKSKMSQKERNNFAEVKVADHEVVNEKIHSEMYNANWKTAYAELLEQAANYPQVERIFVSPPIKTTLCKLHPDNPKWLKKISPYFGHNEHFHVRLACPSSSPDCQKQNPIANDLTDESHVGCSGKSYDWWFSPSREKGTYLSDAIEEAKHPAKKETPDEKVAKLPESCKTLISAVKKR